MKFVVAFNRDRDFYQVPLALEEHGLLHRLITDVYNPDAPFLRRLPGMERLAHRKVAGLPSVRVSSNFSALALQLGARCLPFARRALMRRVDRALSRAAIRTAEAAGADLLLYSGYAEYAFTRPAARGMCKGLFVYHPASALNRRILEEDFARYPECAWSMANDPDTAGDETFAAAQRTEVERSDFLLCASTFTRSSIERCGLSGKPVKVVPYGYDSAAVSFDPVLKSQSLCRFLFVGQGVQRKGLHHLFRAWSLAAPENAELTVISPVMDPGIRSLAPANVKILGYQPRAQLLQHLARADVFVMPSLIEGFGFVYLEALNAGCFVIGTANSGLPDIAPPAHAASILQAGDVAALVAALGDARRRHAAGELRPADIRHFAESLTWANFRRDVAEFAQSDPPRA